VAHTATLHEVSDPLSDPACHALRGRHLNVPKSLGGACLAATARDNEVCRPDDHIRLHTAESADTAQVAWRQHIVTLCMGFRRRGGRPRSLGRAVRAPALCRGSDAPRREPLLAGTPLERTCPAAVRCSQSL